MFQWIKQLFVDPVEEAFQGLSPKDKLAFLRGILKIEKRYLQLSENVTLEVRAMPVETRGYIGRYGETIYLNSDYWYSPKSTLAALVDTVCHECHHLFQNELLLYEYKRQALPPEQQARLDDYRQKGALKQSDLSYDEYQSLPTEVDARLYAEQRWKMYYSKKIKRLLIAFMKTRGIDYTF